MSVPYQNRGAYGFRLIFGLPRVCGLQKQWLGPMAQDLSAGVGGVKGGSAA
jgi:hypothetical protein